MLRKGLVGMALVALVLAQGCVGSSDDLPDNWPKGYSATATMGSSTGSMSNLGGGSGGSLNGGGGLPPSP
jgi:hypothetical protein